MTNGLGAGFFALGLLLALAGLAVLLGLTAVGTALRRRRTGRVPQAAHGLAVALLGVVVAVAGFGVLALADELAVGAALLVLVVFVPLAAAAARARRSRRRPWLEALALAAAAWSLPYLLAVAAFLGVNVGAAELAGLAPAVARDLGVAWYAAAASGAVAVAGTLALVARLGPVRRRG